MGIGMYGHDDIKQEALDEGVPPETFAWLDILTNKQRVIVMISYCRHCGGPQLSGRGCQCSIVS